MLLYSQHNNRSIQVTSVDMRVFDC